jgi:transcriptional regulator with XRE-family HTH domain
MAAISKPSLSSIPSIPTALGKGPIEGVRDLGGYIREQRKTAQISLRQLAAQAGVSNPYLSQIERGLRHPSAEILQQIAKALRISAEALYVQAGILDERHVSNDTTSAILADGALSERQKQVLLEIYTSFRTEDPAAVTLTASASSQASPQTSPPQASPPQTSSHIPTQTSDTSIPHQEATP